MAGDPSEGGGGVGMGARDAPLGGGHLTLGVTVAPGAGPTCRSEMSKMRGTLVAAVALSGVLALPPLAGAVEQDVRADTPPADSRPPDGLDHTLLGLLGPLLGLPAPTGGTPAPLNPPTPPSFGVPVNPPAPPSFGTTGSPVLPRP